MSFALILAFEIINFSNRPSDKMQLPMTKTVLSKDEIFMSCKYDI